VSRSLKKKNDKQSGDVLAYYGNPNFEVTQRSVTTYIFFELRQKVLGFRYNLALIVTRNLAPLKIGYDQHYSVFPLVFLEADNDMHSIHLALVLES